MLEAQAAGQASMGHSSPPEGPLAPMPLDEPAAKLATQSSERSSDAIVPKNAQRCSRCGLFFVPFVVQGRWTAMVRRQFRIRYGPKEVPP